MARIKKISIEGLFGVFDYEIPLNQDDRITILTGPNGFGKTTVIGLVYTLIADSQVLLDQGLDYSEKGLAKFSKVSILLDTGTIITFEQDFFEKKVLDKSSDLYNWDGMKTSIQLTGSTSSYEYMVEFENEADSLTATPIWSDEENEGSRYSHSVIDDLREQVFANLEVEFIESERLVDFLPSRLDGYRITYDIQSKVKKYSLRLKDYLESKVVQYGEVSQRLDKTYPFRVMEKEANESIQESYFVQELQNIRELSKRLATVSILEDIDNGEIERLESALTKDHLDSGTRKMLEVYLLDSQEKYDVFSDTLRKLELFQEILNRKLACSHKQITFSREKGFLVSYKHTEHSNYPQGEVPLTALSSGEQHQIVLLYKLLFEIESGSLVLIDEPEISLHLSWQVEFLEDLQEISRLNDLDFLIATHAPSIIEDRWDLVVELKG